MQRDVVSVPHPPRHPLSPPPPSPRYAASANGSFAQYFFTSADVIAAPVVRKGTVVAVDGYAEYGPMAPKTVWLPPSTAGGWLELPTGTLRTTGGLSKLYDLTEIPIFVRLGALLPSTPRVLGATIGMATRLYEALTFSLYGIDASGAGSCQVYEDDGVTTDYSTADASATTAAAYAHDAASGTTTVTVSPPELMRADAAGVVPATRPYAVRLINAMPPTSITVNGEAVPHSRYAPHATPSWWYEGDETTVVVASAPLPTSAAVGFLLPLYFTRIVLTV